MELVASALGATTIIHAVPPSNPKTGAMRHRLPDEGHAILQTFVEKHCRVPTSVEAHELVARIQRETAYETNVNSVHSWFQRRRVELNLGRLPKPPPALTAVRERRLRQKVSSITQGTVTAPPLEMVQHVRRQKTTVGFRSSTTRNRVRGQQGSAKPNIGGNRQPFPKESIVIFEDFALNHGRYPNAEETRTLIERVWVSSLYLWWPSRLNIETLEKEETRYSTTYKSVKYWFYQHRTKFNLKTLVESSRALHFEGLTANMVKRMNPRTLSKRRRSVASRPTSRSTPSPGQGALACASGPVSGAACLSDAQIAILKALKASGIGKLSDSVISACAASWALERSSIEAWIRKNSTISPSATAASTASQAILFTPISFSIPLRMNRGSESSNEAPSQPIPSLENVTTAGASDVGGERGQAHSMLRAPFPGRWRGQRVVEIDVVRNVLPGFALLSDTSVLQEAVPTATGMRNDVAYPLLEALISALRDSIKAPPPCAKPIDGPSFSNLWLPTAHLEYASDALPLSRSC
ncbi:hypothetical protein NMY22_g6914 [Coprinellus aureogranulatus]|nr:hypothetical protein NMY22_g6914 [Coprinellus aureogranulatus]